MKKLIAAALSLILGTLGYTVVDKTIEDRVGNLEAQVSIQQSIIDDMNVESAGLRLASDMPVGTKMLCIPSEPTVYTLENGTEVQIDSFTNTVVEHRDLGKLGNVGYADEQQYAQSLFEIEIKGKTDPSYAGQEIHFYFVINVENVRYHIYDTINSDGTFCVKQKPKGFAQEFVCEIREIYIGDNPEGTTKKDTTTKKDEGFKIPSSKADIVNAYKNAANKTKAQNNMDVEKTCDVDIKIDRLGGSLLTTIAKEVADSFMNQANGIPEYETFKDGKPTKNTEEKNGKYINDKSTYIPLYGKEELCTLDPQNVVSAAVTRKGSDSYDVKIVLKDDSSDINGIPPITSTGMDYFNPSLYTENLKGIKFSKGTVHYSECIITATVKTDGYISYVKHDMKLKTDDTVVKFLSSDIDAALSGRYITTFKFS